MARTSVRRARSRSHASIPVHAFVVPGFDVAFPPLAAARHVHEAPSPDTMVWRTHSTSKSPRCDSQSSDSDFRHADSLLRISSTAVDDSSATRVHEPLLRAYSSLRRLVSDLATERRRAQVSRRLAACVRRHTARATRLQQQGARLRTHAPAFPGNEHVDCLADDLHWRCRRVLFSPQRHDTPAEARVSVPGHGVSPRHAAHHSAVL